MNITDTAQLEKWATTANPYNLLIVHRQIDGEIRRRLGGTYDRTTAEHCGYGQHLRYLDIISAAFHAVSPVDLLSDPPSEH